MTRKRKKKSKSISKVFILLIVIILISIGVLIYKGRNSNNDLGDMTTGEQKKDETPKPKVDIVNLDSKTRPYAIVINNTAVAVKVQEGLNKAYMVYEFPTEGNTSRLMAFYKDIEEDLTVGTVRSIRHDFIDYALESDAILCGYGWSYHAENELKRGVTDYLQGLYGGPFYRSNPEGLASEHTAYTSLGKLDKAVKEKGFRTTTNTSVLLNYDPEDVDLSSSANVKVANSVTVPYGSSIETASFKYDAETKMYARYENSKPCTDHKTKEAVTTKNIIVQKIGYQLCSDNYYWDLYTIGSGEGYYITNGYAVPITWSKSSRSGKTKYTYKEGTTVDGQDVGGKEISVSDGRTWIEVQTTKQSTTIE